MKYFIAIFVLGLSCFQSNAHAVDMPHLLQESGQPGGLAVIIGAEAAQVVDLARAADGRWSIEALHDDGTVVAQTRIALAQEGLLPQASAQVLRDPSHLPYADHSVSLVIVVNALGVPAPEQQRVLGYERRLAVATGSSLQWHEKPLPDTVGEWTHTMHGPDRIPVSNEATIGPFSDSFRWIAGVNHFSNPKPQNQTPNSHVLEDGRLIMYRYDGINTLLEARCAFSGMLLWTRQAPANPILKRCAPPSPWPTVWSRWMAGSTPTLPPASPSQLWTRPPAKP